MTLSDALIHSLHAMGLPHGYRSDQDIAWTYCGATIRLRASEPSHNGDGFLVEIDGESPHAGAYSICLHPDGSVARYLVGGDGNLLPDMPLPQLIVWLSGRTR